MATIYVSDLGNDANPGTSRLSPKRNLNSACYVAQPGDTVVGMAGSTFFENVWINQRHGRKGAPIVLRGERAADGTLATKLRPPSGGWNAVSVGAHWVEIHDLDIYGARGDGIEANNTHHLTVMGCKIGKSGESGIQTNYGEIFHFARNELYENASTGWFSGISLYQNRRVAPDAERLPIRDGFYSIVEDNWSHHNYTVTGLHTDGNGIIIDDFQSTQTSGFENYTFPTLVRNNLTHDNSGKGIQVTWSDFVSVIGNTAFGNNRDPLNAGTWRGELSNSQSSNNTWKNNIAVADPAINRNNTAIDNTSYNNYQNKNVVWENNLTFNGTVGQASVRTEGGNAMPPAATNSLGVLPQLGSDRIPDEGSVGWTKGIGWRPIGTTPPPNVAPVANPDGGFTTAFETVLVIPKAALLGNDTDADGGTLAITAVTAATGGVAALDAAGVTFTPAAGYSGPAGFSYAITDGQGGTASASVSITVEAPEEPPVDPEPLDLDPVIAVVALSIGEAAPLGTVVGAAQAVDPDGGAVALRLSGDDRFELDAEGRIVTRALLVLPDQEVDLTVEATDDEGNVTTRTVRVTVRS